MAETAGQEPPATAYAAGYTDPNIPGDPDPGVEKFLNPDDVEEKVLQSEAMFETGRGVLTAKQGDKLTISGGRVIRLETPSGLSINVAEMAPAALGEAGVLGYTDAASEPSEAPAEPSTPAPKPPPPAPKAASKK